MKTIRSFKLPLLSFLLTILCAQLPCRAQGTAFTYQGQLDDGGSPANGSYDLTFALYSVSSGPGQIAGTVSRFATPVSNGVFTVTLDFSANFPGADRWLEIGVRTNNGGAFNILVPRQKLTPTPYAITAGNLTGNIGNGQLANSSITVNAGTGLGGGGTVALGGATTLSNAGVLSVTGNSDITANTANGAVTLGDTATSADAPNTLVKRDTNGSFLAMSITLDSNLNLPATTPTAGIIYSGTTTLLHTFGFGSFFAGQGAGNLTNTGSFNTGVGYFVLNADTTGFLDTAFGVGTLENNTTGVANTAVGPDALNANISGGYNVAVGDSALIKNTSGSYNVGIGESALSQNTTGDESTAVGNGALAENTSGGANTAVGSGGLFENTTGRNDTAVGYEALFNNTNGIDNTAVGAGAIGNNTSGSGNTAIGENSLVSNTDGNNNTAAGFLALGTVTSGTGNVGIGENAVSVLSTGSGNVGIGQNASPNLVSGFGNIAIGEGAGGFIVTGNNNIEIGNAGFQDESGVIRIGTQGTHTKAVFNGIFGATVGSGIPVLVNSGGLLGTTTSSRRFKQNIQGMADASDVLLALHPVTFQYKPDLDPDGTPQFGLVAEEVEKVDPDLVLRDDKHQIYTVRYDAVNAMLLNEFLKQHEKVETQKTEIEDLKQRLDKLEHLVNQNARPQTKRSPQ